MLSILSALARSRVLILSTILTLMILSLIPISPAIASTTTVVGDIPGSYGVTSDGAATYTIPISLPRGSGGLTPSIALVYNSQSGTGDAGYGWDLSGFSDITRCNKTIDSDGSTEAIQLASTDDYCLDGQLLRLKSDGVTYDTEEQQFDSITATNGTNGPDHFEVVGPNGTTYEYGNTPDSKILATGTSTVRVWALDRVTDASGNYYTIQYQNNDTTTGDFWPLTITYTENAEGNYPQHTVTFGWTPRADTSVQTGYLRGSLNSQTQLLSSITVAYNGTQNLTYILGYQTDPTNFRN